MEKWITESLYHIVGEELVEDLTNYILSVESETDFDEYMKNLFDFSNKDEKNLYDSIKIAKFGKNSQLSKKVESHINLNVNSNNSSNRSFNQETEQSSDTKKKTKKYRKLQLNELQKGYLKEGRNPCECQATKHKLINNCIECGRIVCEQEGSGPCFFCDNMVCTKEELEILNSHTKEANTLYRTLNERKKSEAWKKAIQNRNKLLDYDKAVDRHTKIIDDEHDYFDVNGRWLTKKEREAAAKRLDKIQEQKHASRLDARKIVLDILGKKAVEDLSVDFEDDNEMQIDETETSYSYKPNVPDIDTLLENFKYDKVNFKHNLDIPEENCNELIKENYVIQDKSFLEMSDRGICLSMHQPWAMLLVSGIKKHEGRTWYTPHRGMLWIAATAKQPDPDTIKDVEQFYKIYYDGVTIKFPDKYPTGCLIGNVLVQDCLSQEEYREVYPTSESMSPYVWICSDPQKLIVPIPMKGAQKLYKLDSKVHTMAKDALIIKKRFAQ